MNASILSKMRRLNHWMLAIGSCRPGFRAGTFRTVERCSRERSCRWCDHRVRNLAMNRRARLICVGGRDRWFIQIMHQKSGGRANVLASAMTQSGQSCPRAHNKFMRMQRTPTITKIITGIGRVKGWPARQRSQVSRLNKNLKNRHARFTPAREGSACSRLDNSNPLPVSSPPRRVVPNPKVVRRIAWLNNTPAMSESAMYENGLAAGRSVPILRGDHPLNHVAAAIGRTWPGITMRRTATTRVLKPY